MMKPEDYGREATCGRELTYFLNTSLVFTIPYIKAKLLDYSSYIA